MLYLTVSTACSHTAQQPLVLLPTLLESRSGLPVQLHVEAQQSDECQGAAADVIIPS